MKQITEQQILAAAPNPAAAQNGKKISQKGGFVKLMKSEDDTFYMGECTGSGKSNYIVSADYVDESNPVFRCSCPSRQFPCKHSLGLMYEMMSGKSFEKCEIPEDIIKKREKKAAKEGKAAAPAEPLTPEEQAKAEKKKASAAKTARSARNKKLKKQLEGLELVSKAVNDLMRTGLGAMGGTSLAEYKALSKQLGDYYLAGPQRLFNKLIIEITDYKEDNAEIHYDNAIDVLEKLRALIKRSSDYINKQIESADASPDDNVLYEELGGVWKLTELEALGRCKKDAHLTQLAFWVTKDDARAEFVDEGAWADLETGDISVTLNYRPFSKLKYVKADDTIFGAADVPLAVYYPGDGNPRIRWDGANIRDLTKDELKKLMSLAPDSAETEAKAVKKVLMGAMAQPMYIKLLAFEKIGRTDEGLTLKTPKGDTVLLMDFPSMETTTDRIETLPDASLLRDGALLAGWWYCPEKRRVVVQPLSIVKDSGVIRLLY